MVELITGREKTVQIIKEMVIFWDNLPWNTLYKHEEDRGQNDDESNWYELIEINENMEYLESSFRKLFGEKYTEKLKRG